MIRVVAFVAVLTGCFHPTYDSPVCGTNGECPNNLVCEHRPLQDGRGMCVAKVLIDARPPDAIIDAFVIPVDAHPDAAPDAPPFVVDAP